jgi:hypothetical protein
MNDQSLERSVQSDEGVARWFIECDSMSHLENDG